MRVFAGIPLPNVAAAVVMGYLNEAAVKRNRIRRVPAENLHCTLFFFGEIPASNLPGLRQGLESIGAGTARFMADFSGGILFPRAAVVPCTHGEERLRTLAGNIAALAGEKSFRYRAHITLARIPKYTSQKRMSELWTHAVTDSVSLAVDSFILYRSNLDPSGASYDPLFRVQLRNELE